MSRAGPGAGGFVAGRPGSARLNCQQIRLRASSLAGGASGHLAAMKRAIDTFAVLLLGVVWCLGLCIVGLLLRTCWAALSHGGFHTHALCS